jgi:predicted Rossmann-fold nucleotide-binding protein
MKPFRVVLFNREYWKGLLEWLKGSVLAKGFISEDHFNHLRVCDQADDVFESVQRWYTNQEVVGRKIRLK